MAEINLPAFSSVRSRDIFMELWVMYCVKFKIENMLIGETNLNDTPECIKFKKNVLNIILIVLDYDRTIIGILGKKHSGKDTVSDYIVAKYGYGKDSFAGPLKRGLKEFFGLTDQEVYTDLKDSVHPELGVTPRSLMTYIGTNIIRNDANLKINPNIRKNLWVRLLEKKFKKDYQYDSIVLSDHRFENECRMVLTNKGFVIKLVRPKLENPSENSKTEEHESEKAVDSVTSFNYIINNCSTIEKLYSLVDEAIELISLGAIRYYFYYPNKVEDYFKYFNMAAPWNYNKGNQEK